MRIKTAFVVLAALSFCPSCNSGPVQSEATPSTQRSVEEVDVFLLAGQSNMEGVGRVELLSEAALAVPHVHLFHSSALGTPKDAHKWLPLRPAGWKGAASGGFGVEMSLGAALSRARPGRQTYFIKHAVGGTALFDDWSPNGGAEFRTFERLVENALSDLESQGLRPVVRGVFWQQGEADAKTAQMSQVYGRRLENFIVRVRARLAAHAPDCSAADVRFVVGQVIPDATPGSPAHKRFPYRDEVRAAQLAVARNLKNVVSVPTDATFETHASDSDGFRDNDNIHFNEAGLAKLGEHMAEAFLREDTPQGSVPRVSLLPALTSASDHPDTLRVATYNTYYVFSKSKQVTAATQWLAAQAPDLVALQELTNITDDRLVELAAGWGHDHSALLKTDGFSVGVTAALPIEVIERTIEGLHHGCLHVRVADVHVFIVHLSPFRWTTRTTEADILLAKIRPLLAQDADVLVLGDFNALSPADRAILAAQPSLLQKALDSDAAHDHVENLRDGSFDFSVMQRFLQAGLEDAALPFLEQSRGKRCTFPSGYWTEGQATPPTSGTRIDHVLASRSMAASAVSAFVFRHGDVNKTSDHYPVVVEFH